MIAVSGMMLEAKPASMRATLTTTASQGLVSPADDTLERGEDVGRHDNRIDGRTGVRAVTALAFHHDPEEIRAGHGTGTDGHTPAGQARPAVEREGRAYIVQQTFLDDEATACGDFFRRLENALDRTLEFATLVPEQRGGAAEDGAVSVVAAGVHTVGIREA